MTERNQKKHPKLRKRRVPEELVDAIPMRLPNEDFEDYSQRIEPIVEEWRLIPEAPSQTKLQDYLLFIKGDKLTAREILSCRNVEIRSLLLNQFGHEKLIKELEGKIIHQDGDSQLINLNLCNITEPIRVVKVKDSTTKKYYILRVPPTVITCKQVIAWTFGLEEEYNPTMET